MTKAWRTPIKASDSRRQIDYTGHLCWTHSLTHAYLPSFSLSHTLSPNPLTHTSTQSPSISLIIPLLPGATIYHPFPSPPLSPHLFTCQHALYFPIPPSLTCKALLQSLAVTLSVHLSNVAHQLPLLAAHTYACMHAHTHTHKHKIIM